MPGLCSLCCFTLCVWCLVFLSTGLFLLLLEVKKHPAQGASAKAEAAVLLIAAEVVLGVVLGLAPVLALVLPEETGAGMTEEETIVVVIVGNPPANRFGVMAIGSVITAAPTILHPVMLALNAENPRRAVAEAVAVAIVMLEEVIVMEEGSVEVMVATEGTTVAVVTAEAEVVAMETVTEVVVTVTEVVATVTEVVAIVMAAAVVVVVVVMAIALLVLLPSSGLAIGTVTAARGITSLPKLPAFVAKRLSLKQAALLSI